MNINRRKDFNRTFIQKRILMFSKYFHISFRYIFQFYKLCADIIVGFEMQS